jgi:5-methylcytosine-specific restriction endonuclease McrBC GTP-binding regulatory subunit McrB
MKNKNINIEIDIENFIDLLKAEIKKIHFPDNLSEKNRKPLLKYYSRILNFNNEKIGEEINHYSSLIKKYNNYTFEGKTNKFSTAEHFYRGALCDKSV